MLGFCVRVVGFWCWVVGAGYEVVISGYELKFSVMNFIFLAIICFVSFMKKKELLRFELYATLSNMWWRF